MGVCLRYMKEESVAQDVLQESFIRIFTNIKHYNKTGSFEAWLRRIVVTSALMELRKTRKQAFKVELESNHSDQLNENAPVEIKLDEADILEMINRLPDHYRLIFNLYIIEGFTHAEIADMLDIKESTSRTKLTRARIKMQEIYLEHVEMMNTRTGSKSKEVFKIS